MIENTEIDDIFFRSNHKSEKKNRNQYRSLPPRFRYRVGPIRIEKLVYQGYGLGYLSRDAEITIDHDIKNMEETSLDTPSLYENTQKRNRKKKRHRSFFTIKPPEEGALHPSPISGEELTRKTFFVAYSAPGDLVEVEIMQEKRGLAYGRVHRIIEPSKERVEPICPAFGICGGCQMQHISYQAELEMKSSVVASFVRPLFQELTKMGKDLPQLMPIVPSPHRTRYRNHVQIKSNRESVLGFFEWGRKQVVPLPEQGCELLPPEMNAFIRNLPREEVPKSYNLRIRQNLQNEVFIKGMHSDPRTKKSANRGLAIIEHPYRSHWVNFFYDQIGEIQYKIRMDNFFQINRFQLDNWVKLIIQLADLQEKKRVVDLYCGGGLITLQLAKFAGEIFGVEINPQSVLDAEQSAALNGLKNVQFVAGDAFAGVQSIQEMDLLIVDPPRAGLSQELLDWLMNQAMSLGARGLIYISCNPATFFRDAHILVKKGAYLEKIYPVDMFPMTYHVELVAKFSLTTD